MTIDLNTGLPEVPEGYFWRVSMNDSDYLVLELMKRTPRWYNWALVTVRQRTTVGSLNYIIERAEDLLTMELENIEFEALVGDYPPKRLEQ